MWLISSFTSWKLRDKLLGELYFHSENVRQGNSRDKPWMGLIWVWFKVSEGQRASVREASARMACDHGWAMVNVHQHRWHAGKPGAELDHGRGRKEKPTQRWKCRMASPAWEVSCGPTREINHKGKSFRTGNTQWFFFLINWNPDFVQIPYFFTKCPFPIPDSIQATMIFRVLVCDSIPCFEWWPWQYSSAIL